LGSSNSRMDGMKYKKSSISSHRSRLKMSVAVIKERTSRSIKGGFHFGTWSMHIVSWFLAR
jgi:hypothetical protein